MDLPTSLATYRQAKALLAAHVYRRTPLTEEAETIIAALGPRMWVYPVTCMLCGATIPYRVTLTQVDMWGDAPTAVCGTH